jgi:hypothetical protein
VRATQQQRVRHLINRVRCSLLQVQTGTGFEFWISIERLRSNQVTILIAPATPALGKRPLESSRATRGWALQRAHNQPARVGSRLEAAARAVRPLLRRLKRGAKPIQAPSDRELTDVWLTEKIKAIHEAKRKVYGAPRIHAELRMQYGIRVGRKRVERLMRCAGISGLVPKKRGRTTIAVPGVRVTDDLVERHLPLSPERPVARRHHLPAQLGGLAVSRLGAGRIQSRDRRLVDGRAHAHRARNRRPADGRPPPAPPAGLVHRSDQGSQYVSLGFGQAARDAAIAISMGSRGNA